MPSRSLTRRQLSRSKIDLFLECPRCFYEDIARNNARPGGLPFTLNNAVDALFKREFDGYRARQQPHPLFATVGLDAVPLADPRMDDWRAQLHRRALAGPGYRLDTLRRRGRSLARRRRSGPGRRLQGHLEGTELAAEQLYAGYRRQAEVYQFLVAQQGLDRERPRLVRLGEWHQDRRSIRRHAALSHHPRPPRRRPLLGARHLSRGRRNSDRHRAPRSEPRLRVLRLRCPPLDSTLIAAA